MSKKKNRRKRKLEETLHHIQSGMYHKGVRKSRPKKSKYIHSRCTYDNRKGRVKRFIRWLVEEKGLSPYMSKAEAVQYIQEYADYLATELLPGKDYPRSPHTIHSDLVAVCRVFGKHNDDYEKPRRGLSKKGRDEKSQEKAREAEKEDPVYAALCHSIGVRSSEYIKMEGKDLRWNADGSVSARVQDGKGGKKQFQRIAPEHQDFVWSFFANVQPNELVFDPKRIRKQPTQLIRREDAQEAYRMYEKEMEEDPQARQRYIEELEAAFKRANVDPKTKKDMQMLDVPYVPRGELRQDLKKIWGEKKEFDRVALMMVAVFHLSHWRVSVVMRNYMR